ncbi:catalase-like domain-containing protein [Penicillium maclennaniae]|uniref:catalase-like domain-containing protein n=1 Tax=Penicillium maclennaniae TaxID=1343394 RepID=UPI00254060BC|nr:catalase-like domain-containing protein [Penicillium maclennaniae]KAJ5681583.1 catalase-like domain-containing protein [Penicillium maclennaniae]
MSNPKFTLAEGQPISDPSISTTLPIFGGGGITTLGDTLLLETLAHFNRERIPERVVHAKASGAWGEYEVTNDISSLTSAKFLNGVGKKTKVLFRLSTTGGEKGSADTVRDVRGFSVKFYTEEGNHDIVGNHIPVFFVRDPIRFPSLNRSHKRHPATNRPDWTMFWDFHVNQPESVHALMHLFGSRGIPNSIRRVTGFGVHTFKMVAEDGSFRYCKFHFRPAQSMTHFSGPEATRVAGVNPDYHNQDLADGIARGEFPVWKLCVQVMEPEQAETYGRALFDITKVWPHKEFPLIEVGKMTLNQNPENYFAEIEQAAFSPSNMVPGIAMTPDPMLQARMFAYPDAQRYRLGVNYTQLPPNRAICPVFHPFERDGMGTVTRNYGVLSGRGVPSQVPSDVRHTERIEQNALLGQHELEVNEEDFIQPRALWNDVFDENERRQWVANVSETLEDVPVELKEAVKGMFSQVDPRIGQLMTAHGKNSSHL